MPNQPSKKPTDAYKAIPDPVPGDDSLYHASVAMKEVIEVLTRQRKPFLSAAVTFKDLQDLGLTDGDGNALQDYGTLLNDLANPPAEAPDDPIIVTDYATKADVEAATIGADPDYLRIAGYNSVGDQGDALYVRAGSEPSHNGKIQSDDGAWWELAVTESRPQMFGAVADGSDCTAAIISALDYGVPVYCPPGGYGISSEVVHNHDSRIYGAGRNATVWFALDDVTLLRLTQSGSCLSHIGFSGSNDFGAANPCVEIDDDCNNCHIMDNFFQGGRYPLLNRATDNTFLNNEFRYGYGSAIVKCVSGSGNFFLRNKIDQVWPVSQPNAGTVVSARLNSHAYTVGTVVTLSGWYLQCTVAGTSGGSPPALQPYETDIVDGGGSLRWQIVCPTTYYSFQMDNGASEIFMFMNDHSGCFDVGIGMTATDDDAGGDEPFRLYIMHAIIGQQQISGIRCESGHDCIVSNCEIGVGWGASDAFCIDTQGDWDGNLRVADNQFFGGNSAGVAVKLFGEYSGAYIVDNNLTGEFSRFCVVDPTGDGIYLFRIADNDSVGGTGIDIGTDTDLFDVSHNFIGGVTNSSSGGTFVDQDNV